MIQELLALALAFICVALFTIYYLKFWIWFMLKIKAFLIWSREKIKYAGEKK